jgi:hypothetical protein
MKRECPKCYVRKYLTIARSSTPYYFYGYVASYPDRYVGRMTFALSEAGIPIRLVKYERRDNDHLETGSPSKG